MSIATLYLTGKPFDPVGILLGPPKEGDNPEVVCRLTLQPEEVRFLQGSPFARFIVLKGFWEAYKLQEQRFRGGDDAEDGDVIGFGPVTKQFHPMFDRLLGTFVTAGTQFAKDDHTGRWKKTREVHTLTELAVT